MAFGKKNEIKLDPFAYNIGLLGVGGVGKTTTVYKMCQKHLGDDGYLFVETGKEDGADAIDGINYINCPAWRMAYDEDTNSVGFKELVDDILENKAEDYPNLRTIVIDTYDQLKDIADVEIVRQHNRLHSDKKVKSIKAAFGGYMAGEDMADDLILNTLWELKRVGVSFIIIGHVKQREITDPVTGDVYDTLTTDMSMRSFNKIKNKLHFLGVAFVDREIVKDNKAKANGGDKHSVKSESRRITFRDDNYAIDSKSRFAEIVSSVPLSGDDFYDAMENAIRAEAQKGGKSLEDMKVEQAEIAKKSKERADSYSKAKKDGKVDVEENEALKAQMVELFMSADKETTDSAKAKMVELGIEDFSDVSTIPTAHLKAIIDILS